MNVLGIDSPKPLVGNWTFSLSNSPTSFKIDFAVSTAFGPAFVIFPQSFENYASETASFPLVLAENFFNVSNVSGVIFQPRTDANLMHLHTATGCFP